MFSWLRTRRALIERIRHLEDKLTDERRRATKASEAAGYWAGQYNRVAAQRDAAIALANEAKALVDERAQLAKERRAFREEHTARDADLAVLDLRRSDRQVGARLSTETLPCGCGHVMCGHGYGDTP